jgi:fumarate reductase (CoM/CoB) subunit A
MKTEIVNTNVLVIGGGGAGCRAAIEAHDEGAEVLMIVKGRLGHSGCTLHVGISSAVGPWADEADSNEISMRDLLSHGGFLGNQDLAKIVIEDSLDRVLEMERWGIEFDRTDGGEMRVTQDPEHSYPRSFYFKPSFPSTHDYGSPPGIAMMDILMREMKKRNIPVMNDVVLVDLLTTDGRIVGATALDCSKGELMVIKARSVVLATGTYSQIFDPTTVSSQETGDGHCAAYRAGAELIDMENTQFVATETRTNPESIFLNNLGEEFLPKYGIRRPRDVTKEELCYAVWKEVREGRGTKDEKIYIDVNGTHHMNLSDPGVIKSGPRAHTTTGGLKIDNRCETTLPGLYASGAIAGAVYGHARPQGYTSMITLVLGKRAGLFAAKDQALVEKPVLDEAQVKASMKRATDLVERSGGLKPNELKAQIRSTMRRHAWVIKDKAGLTEGLEKIREIREIMKISAEHSTSRVSPVDGFNWAEYLEVPNMLLTSEMMLVGSLERKESRGAFFRDDYPDTDNENWLKNIVYSKVQGSLNLKVVSVDLKYCKPELEEGGGMISEIGVPTSVEKHQSTC